MSNKGGLIINGVLGVAVIILFVMQFSGGEKPIEKSETEKKEAINEKDVVANQTPDFGGLKIGYVNSDTVTVNYEYSKQLSKDLMSKQASAENKLRKEAEKFQKDYEAFQQGAPIMGQSELERKQAELMQRQQELQQMEYDMSQKLQDKGFTAQREYIEETDKYMQKIGKELGYDYVFGYRTGDLLMYANPKFDITRQVIELLNEAYKADKQAN